MGSPQPAPSSLPHCGSPGMGGYGEGQTLHACTQGDAMEWEWAACHPGSLPQAESSQGGEGCTVCTPSWCCGEGMLRAWGTGRHGVVLTTADMLSSVLCRLQDTGRGKEESAAARIPTASAAPMCPVPCAPSPAPLAHPNRPQLHHMLPASLPACQRLGSFEKHRRCLQMQFKIVGIDCPTPSPFFSGSAFPLEVGGIS